MKKNDMKTDNMKKMRHSFCKKFIAAAAALLLFSLSFPLAGLTAEELMYALEYKVVVDSSQSKSMISNVRSDEDVQTPANQTSENQTSADTAGQTDYAEQILGAYTAGYDNRVYISLRDLAVLLNGTSAQFQFAMDYESDSYAITTGIPYEIPEPVMQENPEEEPEKEEGDYHDEDGNLLNDQDEIIWEAMVPVVRPQEEYLELYQNPLMINGRETRYYTYQLSVLEDIYMNIIDVQLALGITIEQESSDALRIYTDRGFEINLETFEEDGYFDLFNGVILGDATTGEILYGRKENNMDAIASTSKLMTYMVIARFLETGRIGMDDVVTLSQNVEDLAYSWYGTFYMDAGQEVTVKDLLGALLINSSNESGLALGEYAAGSEEAFVGYMNEMARYLGLTTARFYNTNGLPEYTDSLIASKVQNRMSAADLFRLCSVILRKYPEILDYTSQKTMYLDSFGFTVNNTNYLLYNMENCIGLKTGTTDEAGCCLCAAAKVQKEDGEHILVAIVLGAESNLDRYQPPHLLLTWGMNQ